jgi:hypothetical protein
MAAKLNVATIELLPLVTKDEDVHTRGAACIYNDGAA